MRRTGTDIFGPPVAAVRINCSYPAASSQAGQAVARRRGGERPTRAIRYTDRSLNVVNFSTKPIDRDPYPSKD